MFTPCISLPSGEAWGNTHYALLLAIGVRSFDQLITMCSTQYTSPTHTSHTHHSYIYIHYSMVCIHFSPNPIWFWLLCLHFHLHRKILEQVADVKTQREGRGNKYANEQLIKVSPNLPL